MVTSIKAHTLDISWFDSKGTYALLKHRHQLPSEITLWHWTGRSIVTKISHRSCVTSRITWTQSKWWQMCSGSWNETLTGICSNKKKGLYINARKVKQLETTIYYIAGFHQALAFHKATDPLSSFKLRDKGERG